MPSPSRRMTARKLVRGLWRDKPALLALVFMVVLILAALTAEWILPFDPREQDLQLRNSAPFTAGRHVLGTDHLGRDILSRLVFGARVSLSVATLGTAVSGAFGLFMGLIAGFYRGKADALIMRLVDLQMSFPYLLLAIFVLFAIGPGFVNLVVVLAVLTWPTYARVSRSMALSLRESGFIDSARVLGAGNPRIIFRHILPNLLTPMLVLAILSLARTIIAEASLSFLGLGVQPPTPSWGIMISDGRKFLFAAWWIITLPGIAILLTALSLNLLSIWARSISDPAQRWRWLAKERQVQVVVASGTASSQTVATPLDDLEGDR